MISFKITSSTAPPRNWQKVVGLMWILVLDVSKYESGFDLFSQNFLTVLYNLNVKFWFGLSDSLLMKILDTHCIFPLPVAMLVCKNMQHVRQNTVIALLLYCYFIF